LGAAQSSPAFNPTPRNALALPQEIPLPQKENRFAIHSGDITLKRVNGAWQLWTAQRMLRDFGDNENNARDALRVYREIHPTEWATIGSPRPVVEYGLVNGRPSMAAAAPATNTNEPLNPYQAGAEKGPLVSGAGAKAVIPIDLKTVRVEAIRGVWCVRDDNHILFNFGPNKVDAEQARGVILRYGFNRVGVVGAPTPVMNYLFASSDNAAPKSTALTKLELQAQIEGLNRVGIPVAGVGYVGEMFHFDPRRIEARKDGSEWVVASGGDVIGRFGPTEYAARDAVRTIQQARFNEFCTVGSGGLTFFLIDGKAPTRVPYHTQGRSFDLASLKVRQLGEKWAVTDNGRHLLDVASAEEGETLVRLLKDYKFDQICHMGPTPKVGISFFARNSR